MPVTIEDKITELQGDPNFTLLNTEIQPKVQEMILSLVKTSAWEEFVKNFIDDSNSEEIRADQLARLTLQDNMEDHPYVQQTVAYLFANCVCGGTTGSRLHENIDALLDTDIDYNK